MDILYQDNSILVCIKPAGVLSTDEPGGVPELVRQALGDPKACVRTVHPVSYTHLDVYKRQVSLSLNRFIALSVASGYFRMVRNRYQPCFP